MRPASPSRVGVRADAPVVLDAGAALERDDRTVWVALRRAADAGASVIVPVTALAQVWRGAASQARLARALNAATLASFDRELCARTRTTDACDAHVALVAASRGGSLWTSDPDDLRKLVEAADPRRSVRLVRC